MSILLSKENEECINNKNKSTINNSETYQLSKYFKGIWIYFKDYILFLKGNSIKVFKMMNYAAYHWGFQMILLIGMAQSYGAVNVMAQQFSTHLVYGGEIE